MVARVESWLAGTQLAPDVPILSGKIDYDDSAVVKRRLTITVPADTADRTWDPAGAVTAPLAAYGQRLHVFAGIGYPNGQVELCDHGWYLITKWQYEETERTISVEAQDLAQLVVDDRLTAASSPPAGTTYGAEFTRLLSGILPARIDLPDRSMSANNTTVWERERDQALNELCAAWPARWYVDDTGTAVAAPVYPIVTDTTPPDMMITDGGEGIITARQRGQERGALFNVSVVDGKANDDGSPGPHAVRQITSPSSPIRVGGPYGRVPRFYASDLITTQGQANDVAAANLVTYATAGRSEPVSTVPDPCILLGDVARVFTQDGKAFTGRITAIGLPLTPDEAPMTITVAMLPAGVTDEATTRGGV
jgi:hypothetical protein